MTTKLSPAERFLKKYYPVPADTFTNKPLSKAQWIKALKHSIRKWEGFLAVRTGKEEGLSIGHCTEDRWGSPEVVDVNDNRVLPIKEGSHLANSTCALCCLAEGECGSLCILKDRCDRMVKGGSTPWMSWLNDYNPRPMLSMLRRELKKLQAKKG